MDKKSKIFIAGHKGMVGSAVQRLFETEGFSNIQTVNKPEVDLTDQSAVSRFFAAAKPEYVILAAARVGGINANLKYPASFLYENLQIQNNVIHASYLNSVQSLVFLGSSCIYPRECPQPMKEEYLLTGKLEPTNEGYALAKIAGLKMCSYYKQQYGMNSISLMPCNLYGPNDSFNLEHSHVLSALVKRFSDAAREGLEEVTLWGSGVARREFMHVDDVAAAVLFFMQKPFEGEFINVGWGEDISIADLAKLIASKAGYKGNINWDTTKPDGMLRKCMDVSRMKAHGFIPAKPLDLGIEQMIELYHNQ